MSFRHTPCPCVLALFSHMPDRYQQYHAIAPSKSLKFEPIQALQTSALNRQFQSTIRMASLLPRSVKQQVVNTMSSLTGEDGWRSVLFQGFCYTTGWGVKQDLKLGKDLIDEASRFSHLSAIFQTMFLTFSKENEDSLEELDYAKRVNAGLDLAQLGGSHEATHKMMQYFPVPGGHARLRSVAYRYWKYGIVSEPRKPKEGEDACMIQEEDIRSQFLLRGTIFSRYRHNNLHFAVAMGYTEAVGAMLDAPDFDPSFLVLQDYNGDTPLLLSLRFGWHNIALRLIDAGSDIFAHNTRNETAFHFLVEFHQRDEKEELAELLFALCGTELATHVCHESSFPKEPLWLMGEGDGAPLNRIVFRNDTLLAKIFMKHHITPAPQNGDSHALILAAALHSWEMLEIFWQSFPELPIWGSGMLLAKACLTFRPQRMYFHGVRTFENVGKCLGFLMERQAALSGTPLLLGDTPLLHFAIHHSVDEEVLQYIISRSSVEDINAYTSTAYLSVTAIHLAIQSGSSAVVESLIRKGGDVLRPVIHSGLSHSTSTMQMCAGHQSTTDRILQLVLDAYVETSTLIPVAALVSAVGTNNFSGAALLIKAGVDINELDDAGTTPLGVVLRQCTIDTVARVRFLLEYPPTVVRPAASFIVKPAVDGTVFHSLAVIPHCTPSYDRRTLRNITDYLLDKFSDPAQINSQTKITGITALHLAAEANPEVVRKLLKCDAVDMAIKSTRDRKTARQYNDEHLVQPVPKIVARLGESAKERYRRDQIEVRNLFAVKCGEEQKQWRSARKIGQINVGGGKIGNIMFISLESDSDE